MTCELRPRPLIIFIVSGLTLTCGRWALPNGDVCIENIEKWISNVDEMMESGKDEGNGGQLGCPHSCL